MKRKRILALLLSLILLFSVFASSCAEEPAPSADESNDEPTEENGVPNVSAPLTDESAPALGGKSDDGSEEEYIVIFHKSECASVSYKLVGEEEWKIIRREEDLAECSSIQYELIPWDDRYASIIEPGGSIYVDDGPHYHSSIGVSPTVYSYLESWSSPTEKKKFVIFMYSPQIEELWPSMEEYHNHHFPGIQVIENTWYGIWEGTAEEFKKITAALMDKNDYIYGTDVCFPEDIEYLFGVTIEQAQILVRKGHLSRSLRNNEKESPLYGLSSAEIAAYIAAHPELLEE